MKDNNNKRMNNQGRNNNHCITFVEHISDMIRRNSTAPQFIGGDFAIVNGDVEAVVTVNCSNAAYRASVTESTLPRPYFTPNLGYVYVPSASCSSKDHEKMPAECKDCTGCCLPVDDDHSELKDQPTIDNSQAPVQHDDTIITAKQELENLKKKHAESSFSEKLADDYYNKSFRLKTKISNAEDEDLLVNILTGLQLIKAFESFIYSIRKNVTIINERDAEEVRLDYALMRFGISEAKAAEVFSRIHDCLGFDVFTIKATNNHVYITCGNVDGVLETFCSTSKETSMQFITRMMEANKP